MRIMNSFEGQSAVIQHQIAHDINTRAIDESLNIYDLVQSYCASIAATGSGIPEKRIFNIEDKWCDYCNKSGHTIDECRTYKRKVEWGEIQDTGNGKGGKGGKGKSKGKGSHITCYRCGKQGHKSWDCTADIKDIQAEEAPQTTEDQEHAQEPTPQNEAKEKVSMIHSHQPPQDIQSGLRTLICSLNT